MYVLDHELYRSERKIVLYIWGRIFLRMLEGWGKKHRGIVIFTNKRSQAKVSTVYLFYW